ncbi:MAG: hypothetical protein RRB22_07720 [Gammaproteobacteria bacterium]|nr:hypothetical protein [Gammaproteobacteria bacterium]
MGGISLSSNANGYGAGLSCFFIVALRPAVITAVSPVPLLRAGGERNFSAGLADMK